MDVLDQSASWWLIAAALLAVAELVVPGVFLMFVAIAAAITGALALLLPGLGIPGQMIAFAVWTVVTVMIGRRWYRDYPVDSADPLLNDRAARLIGEVVTVTEAFESGRGRVRVGDGEWPARGPDCAIGARVRVTGAQGASLVVEPIRQLES